MNGNAVHLPKRKFDHSARRALRSRTAAARVHAFDHQKVLPSNMPSKVASMNTTYNDVYKIVQSANTTIWGVFQAVEDGLGTMMSVLTDTKAFSIEHRPELGKQLTDWVDAFVDTMQAFAGSISTHEKELLAQTQKSLLTVSEDVALLRELVVYSYNKAGSAVDKLSDECIAALEGQAIFTNSPQSAGKLSSDPWQRQAQTWNPSAWMKGVVSGRGKSPCRESVHLMRRANDTANEVAVRLSELNNTIDALFVELQDGVLAGISKIDATYNGAMEQAAVFMSDKIKNKIDKAVNAVLALVGLVDSKISAATESLQKQVRVASIDMLPLYDASDMLLKAAEPCCIAEQQL